LLAYCLFQIGHSARKKNHYTIENDIMWPWHLQWEEAILWQVFGIKGVTFFVQSVIVVL
jgi:hypothetical protein